MIPTVLVLGFMAGLVIYRRAWWFVPVAAVAWTLLVALAGSCAGSCSASAAVLGALNATVGVSVGVALRWVVTRTSRALHPIR